MVPMNLTRYMLEYTLEVICHGNRSECARRMGMEYLEFKKLRNRIMAGGTSSRLPEAILEMYWRENISLDDMLRSYTETYFGADIEAAEGMCAEFVKIGNELLEGRRQTAQDRAVILNAARVFFSTIVQYYCNHACHKLEYMKRETACPINRFLEYMKWLQSDAYADDVQ